MKHQEEMFRDASVVVTGGCGFVGSHLVERLVGCGAMVTVFDNLRDGSLENLCSIPERFSFFEGDVRDVDRLEALILATAPAFVFHLAANASVPGSVENAAYDFETNCAGTFRLLSVLHRHQPEARVVMASSGAVYGEPAELPIHEAVSTVPISPYGASKLAAEIESRMFNQVYGLPVVIARIFNVYGPRMPRFVVFDFLKKLEVDESVLEILGDGRQVRDFTAVTDSVEGLLLLALHGVPGQAYNVASGTSYQITELAELLLVQLDLTGRTRLCFSGESWVGDAQRWEVDIRKLRGLGFIPRISLAEGLATVIRWFSQCRGAE